MTTPEVPGIVNRDRVQPQPSMDFDPAVVETELEAVRAAETPDFEAYLRAKAEENVARRAQEDLHAYYRGEGGKYNGPGGVGTYVVPRDESGRELAINMGPRMSSDEKLDGSTIWAYTKITDKDPVAKLVTQQGEVAAFKAVRGEEFESPAQQLYGHLGMRELVGEYNTARNPQSVDTTTSDGKKKTTKLAPDLTKADDILDVLASKLARLPRDNAIVNTIEMLNEGRKGATKSRSHRANGGKQDLSGFEGMNLDDDQLCDLLERVFTAREHSKIRDELARAQDPDMPESESVRVVPVLEPADDVAAAAPAATVTPEPVEPVVWEIPLYTGPASAAAPAVSPPELATAAQDEPVYIDPGLDEAHERIVRSLIGGPDVLVVADSEFGEGADDIDAEPVWQDDELDVPDFLKSPVAPAAEPEAGSGSVLESVEDRPASFIWEDNVARRAIEGEAAATGDDDSLATVVAQPSADAVAPEAVSGSAEAPRRRYKIYERVLGRLGLLGGNSLAPRDEAPRAPGSDPRPTPRPKRAPVEEVALPAATTAVEEAPAPKPRPQMPELFQRAAAEARARHEARGGDSVAAPVEQDVPAGEQPVATTATRIPVGARRATLAGAGVGEPEVVNTLQTRLDQVRAELVLGLRDKSAVNGSLAHREIASRALQIIKEMHPDRAEAEAAYRAFMASAKANSELPSDDEA